MNWPDELTYISAIADSYLSGDKSVSALFADKAVFRAYCIMRMDEAHALGLAQHVEYIQSCLEGMD